MDRISLMPIIEKKLKNEFCNSNLLKNPRINELSHILVKLSENYGNILDSSVMDETHYT